jgi:hypothetical protein
MKILLQSFALFILAVATSVSVQEFNDEPLNDNWAPLKLKGATGSPGNPMALY